MSAGADVAVAHVGFTPEQIDQSANTRDLPYKWVVLVDETLPAGRAVNAAICIASATVSRAVGLLGEDAVDADGSVHPGLPWLGCTVLGAPRSRLTEIRNQATARPDVVVADMPTHAHTRVYDDYLQSVSNTRGSDMSYYAVSLFGPRKVVDKLVKGLSLLP